MARRRNNKQKPVEKVVVEVDKTPARPQARKRTTRRKNGNKVRSGAPVSTASTVNGMMNSSVRLKGVDRFAHIADVVGKAEGTVLLDVPMACTSLPRLSHMSEAYQRVRWHSLVFKVETMCPTAVTGGYVASFVRDADDVTPGGLAALSHMVAQKGSRVCKAWQSTQVSVGSIPDLLYTSVTKTEARLWSPGRFLLAVDSKIAGASGQAVPITVYVDWDVTFSAPSLENDVSAKPITAQANFYSRSQNVGLWWKDGDGGDDPRSAIPDIRFNVVYNLPSRRFCGFEKEAGSYSQVVMVNDATHGVTFYIVGFQGKQVVEKTDKNYFILEKGEQLTPSNPLNLAKGLQHLCSHRIESFSGSFENLSLESQ